MRPLSLLEARVLGVLVEKAHTVPDSYPLSLNALTLGCNQKTARDPVLGGERRRGAGGGRRAEAALSLAFESSGSRVSRYEHNLGRALGLPSQSVALLAMLMLRGPQTDRRSCAPTASGCTASPTCRRSRASSTSWRRAPEEKGGPLVVQLARAPGAREARWAQLLAGPVDASALPAAATATTRTSSR